MLKGTTELQKLPVHEDTRSGLYQDMHAKYRVDQTMPLTSS
ncbi:hypothetical protein JL09_g5091 [Pichia kudriavzevii]|uniref:Uncharacterized protein n=1 Tax=Pichia kudriavzevii TaxID=4909 RepID=A0A099NUV2_PICKU|nr:hypothetical protein JL09_g5091 [Pichia kudriavzevii]